MKDKIKNILRGHVEKHESPVDAADIWSGLQAEMNKDKKKRKLLGLYFALGLGLFMVGAYLNLDDNNDNQISQNEIGEATEHSTSAIDASMFSKVKSSINLEEVKAKIQNSKKNKASIANQSEASKQLQTKVVNLDSKLSAVQGIGQSSTRLKGNIGEATIVRSQAIDVNTNISVFVPASPQAHIGLINSEIQVFENNDEEKEVVGDQIKNGTEIKESLLAEDPRLRIDVLKSLSALKSAGLMNVTARNVSSLEENLVVVDVEKNKQKKSSFSFIAGVGLFTKSIVANGEQHSAYADARELYEAPLEVFSIQGLYTVPLIGKLNLSSGLNYVVLNEELNWSGSYYVDGNGAFIPQNSENVIGESYYQKVNHSLVTFNQSKSLSIPVLIGIGDRRKRFSYGIKAGINLQTRSKSVGVVLDENLIPTVVLEQKFGLGFQSKLDFGYFILPGLEILGDLSMMQLNAREALVSHKIQSYILGFGLRKSL